MAEPLTEDLIDELQHAPSLDGYLASHEPGDRTLADYLNGFLASKRLERASVVRMANLNETFGYQIFKGDRHPSRDKVLQIAFAMALDVRETNRALALADVGALTPKSRRDAIIIFCIDHGCSLQKVNEELYRFGEDTIC